MFCKHPLGVDVVIYAFLKFTLMTMKNFKKFLFALSCGAFAMSLNAAELKVAGGTTLDITEGFYEIGDYGDYSTAMINGTLNWTPAADSAWKEFVIYAENDYTKGVNTVTVYGKFNAKGDMYLNAGRIKVAGILDNTGNYFEMGSDGKAYLLITGNGATASFGDMNIKGGTYSNVRVEYGGTLNANNITVHQNNTESQAVLSMNQGGTINANKITAEVNALIQIGKGTINVKDINVAGQSKNEKGRLELGTGAELNINGGTSSVLANTTIASGAVLNVNAGKVSTYGVGALALNGGYLNIADGASIVVENAAMVDEASNYTFVVGGGKQDNPSKIDIKGSGFIHLANSQGGNDMKMGDYSGKYGYVHIRADRQGSIISDKITFINSGTGKDSTMVLNSKNIFVGSKAYDSSSLEYVEGYENNRANFDTMIVLGSSVSAEIVVNADSAFGAVSYQQNCELILTLGDTGVISFTEFQQGYAFENASYARLTINEFENNRVFIENMAEVGDVIGTKSNLKLAITATLSDNLAKYYDDVTYTNVDFEMVAGEHNGVSGYWLNISAIVPEPAEWAAIFGAVALAFAMYRRRK